MGVSRERAGNARGSAAVSVGIDAGDHAAVRFFAREQLARCCNNASWVRSHETDLTGVERLLAFGNLAQHQYGLAERWGFFLNASGIGNDEVACLHQAY